MGPKLEDVPELIQHIQSRLSVKEATRTSLVSKSWLHAWYTNPTLRFSFLREKQLKLEDVDRTLVRYLSNNTPIERFDLIIDIDNQESASYVKKWIGSVANKSCLKELFLSIGIYHLGDSFMLPDEILSGESLTKLRIEAMVHVNRSFWMTTNLHPVIRLVSLRELNLSRVNISEEVLQDILSSCKLLEKIDLSYTCKGFKTIKVKNLPHLNSLGIALEAVHSNSTALEISDVPNLGVFSFHVANGCLRYHPLPLNAHSLSLGRTLTQLMLGGVVKDNASLEMIASKFPFLVTLKLDMRSWVVGGFHFTCASIKRLSLELCPPMLTDVQIFAPKLTVFQFSGEILPSLLFTGSPPKKIWLTLSLNLPVDANFFLKMRETLMLSSTFYLDITTDEDSNLPVDIDDLRTRLLFLAPARNVQQLSFQTVHDECLWERSIFFDAFFEICRPRHVCARPDQLLTNNNYFCRLMVKEVLEKKTETAYWARKLKHVKIREDDDENWETLTNSHRSFLDGSAPHVYSYKHFKLRWR